ncbi:Sad1/UNC domain protein [Zostera marina]|uniref:Sad1/UNC domain protein n=1 Tax=Zostera marina TaxID=29655 RepID=A0A0K9NM40_ZOSMR|nr:Sad1/UNC domain protein [Zostera marina]
MQKSCEALLFFRRVAIDRSGSKHHVLISWGILFLMSTFISPGNCCEDGMCGNINEVGYSQVSTSESCLAQEYGESEVHEEQSMDNCRTGQTCGVNDEFLIRKEDTITENKIEVPSPTCDEQVISDVTSDSQIKEEKNSLNGDSVVNDQELEHALDEEHLNDVTNPENKSISMKEQVLDNTSDSKVKEEIVPTPMENLDPEVKKENRSTTNENNLSILEDAYETEVESEKEAPKHDITTEKEPALAEHPGSGINVVVTPKYDKLSRVTPPSLGEFKSRTLSLKERHGSLQSGSSSVVKNRVEPSGKEYNYASASKGAKVLAFNKEANGASNILAKDKDKYLRNPCSAEGKYVVIELSEETLVDTIEIGNFEHYSSNFKEFELLKSLVYPTDSWIKIANFTAMNVKQKQRFVIQEPKWARYLKLNLPTHYGSEFYCTLSVLEVYGVDAVETMLEDLIKVQDNQFGLENPLPPPKTHVLTPQIDQQKPCVSDTTNNDGGDIYSEIISEMYYGPKTHTTTQQSDDSKRDDTDPTVAEKRPSQIGRMPGDTVLKILMQKVRSLDENSAVLERYLEDLNNRYAKIFRDIDSEIDDKELALNQIRTDVTNIRISQDAIRKDIGDLYSWKSIVSSQLDRLVDDNADLRLEVEKVCNNQVDMENRGLVVIVISFGFGIFALFKVVLDLFASACNIRTSEAVCNKSCGWILLLLSSSLVTFIIVL